MASKLRFFYNGIKVVGDAKLIKAFAMLSEKGWKGHPAGTITVYARNYRRFPEAVHQHFVVENATDSQTDYFEEDHFKVSPGHPLYAAVKEGMIDARAEHYAKREAGKGGKLQALAVKMAPKPEPVSVGAEIVKMMEAKAKEADLKAKGLAVAAEYLRLYGPLKEVVEDIPGKPSMVFEKQIEGDPDEPEVLIRTYVDLYEI